MSTLTIAIVVVFCVGYLFIALESVTKVNKAAVALLMFVVCWTLFMIDPGSYLPGFSGQELINKAGTAITEHLGARPSLSTWATPPRRCSSSWVP